MVGRLASALVLVCALAWSIPVVAQVPVPVLTGHVTDQTGTLSVSQKASLEQALTEFEARKGSQLAVLMVASTAPEVIEQFSLRAYGLHHALNVFLQMKTTNVIDAAIDPLLRAVQSDRPSQFLGGGNGNHRKANTACRPRIGVFCITCRRVKIVIDEAFENSCGFFRIELIASCLIELAVSNGRKAF